MFGPEFQSWFGFHSVPNLAGPPKVGDEAPSTSKLHIQPNKQTVVTFLRHCGCPFAEQTFLRLREAAKTHSDIDFIAVSHSDQKATEKWHKDIGGIDQETSNLSIVVDSEKEAYGQWGLGASSFFHVLQPQVFSNVSALKKSHGIDIRATESGSRWQTAGSYAVDENGKIRWGGPSARADDVPSFEEAIKALGSKA